MKIFPRSLLTVSVILGLSAMSSSLLTPRVNSAENVNSTKSTEEILLSQGRVFCTVARIRTGQLAVRFNPGGESRAGLNNGNTVRLLDREGRWAYIRIVDGPTRQLNGVEGWVNSDYLDCWTQ
ncbi:SH3 domain-containing protein [Spirulina sp. 06S082]|uniref:SH3 domain-containing protein n=1 Tax=Spirulina sp. 06S082 TaxID=3110248 RepID=UPI002B1F8A4D|nr:SH3 domain-containing protein [Spirulina sp. 06S082]MEA5469272.1 SH3 domain-containing protein [Spirulina sp. 06S082]